MAKVMTIDDFLRDKSNDYSGGGGGKYLRRWKENKKVRVWLHTKQPMAKLRRHGGIPKVVTMTDRDTDEQVTKLWPGFYECHEKEEFLKENKRDKETGELAHYPKHCPLCRLVETIRSMVASGQLSFTKPIFKFESDDPDAKISEIVLHAGGIYGAFGWRDLDERYKSEMRKARIDPQIAWTESCVVKTNYLFCVVDHDAPENGVQIAIESDLLGKKVYGVIDDTKESLGVEEGNPSLHPYAFMWRYNDKKNLPINEKYHALRLESVEPTEEILDLIRGPAPDISKEIKSFNIPLMRSLLEKHALVKLPWDEIFDVPASHQRDEEEPEQERRPAGRVKSNGPTQRQQAPQAPRTAPKAPKPPPPDEQDDEVECDACGKAMSESAEECPHCGQSYAKQPDTPAPPATRKHGKKSSEPPSSGSLFNDNDDDIGF